MKSNMHSIALEKEENGKLFNARAKSLGTKRI